jgi:hypothetical protein
MNRNRGLVRAVSATGVAFGSVAAAFADATPTTNGGDGAGHSGRCAGPARDRPELEVGN